MSQAMPKTKPVAKAEKVIKVKDENAPKRPLSAFFNYQGSIRA